MKKRYYVKQRPFLIIFALVLIIILAAGIVVNAIQLYNMKDVSLGILPIVSIIVCVFLLALIAFIAFNTHYTLRAKHFSFVIGFIWSSKPYRDILLLRESPERELLVMYFKKRIKGEDYIEHMLINIRPEHFDDFVNTLRLKNPKIKYELWNDNPVSTDITDGE